MRNVILSAFPRNMRLPDPSTPNLKVHAICGAVLSLSWYQLGIFKSFFLVLQIDLLAEISIAPQIMSDVDGALKSKQLKTEVDEYLKVK